MPIINVAKQFLSNEGHTGYQPRSGADGARIYSMKSVKPALANLCERALAENKFQYHGTFSDNEHAISFTCDGITFVGLIEMQTVEELGRALIVLSVDPVGSEGTTAYLNELRECYGE